MATTILDRVVRTEPLGSSGASGSRLERGWLDDESTVVIKHADAHQDWIMQATGDDGRIATMWADGVFARLPVSVDHAMLAVERGPGGAVVVMRDVSAHLLTDQPSTAAERDVLLRAASEMHAALVDVDVDPGGLCPLPAYLTFLSPAVCARFTADHLVPRLAVEGWARFPGLVDADVAAAVAAVHVDPVPLSAALLQRPSTLVHGDLKLANLGVDGARAVLIDWGTLTTWAPPAVDFAWYLAINAAATSRTHDELLDEIRAAQGGAYDATAQSLALLGALAQLGWEKALGATSDDPAVAGREQAGLAWWSAAVRGALD